MGIGSRMWFEQCKGRGATSYCLLHLRSGQYENPATAATTLDDCLMWSTSAGSEIIKPLATSVLGGLVSSLLHVLIVTATNLLFRGPVS